MRPLRIVLNGVGLILFPPFLLGAAAALAADAVGRRLARSRGPLTASIADEVESWLVGRPPLETS
jgi:hypothetical protein